MAFVTHQENKTLIPTFCGSDGFLFALDIDICMRNTLLTNLQSRTKYVNTIAFILSLTNYKSLYLDLK